MYSGHGLLHKWAGFSSITAIVVAAALHAAEAGSGIQLSTTNSQLVQPCSSQPIPWSDLGAKATAQYTGDGLAVLTAADGTVQLRCVFQKLGGEVTREGLWLTSTGEESRGERFRVVAKEVGRSADFGVRRQSEAPPPPLPGDVIAVAAESGVALRFPPQSKALSPTGTVAIDGHKARLSRPGLVEEYSVSMDGVRQDFIILSRPLNSQPSTLNSEAGELQVRLDVTGARVEPTAGGAQLVLEYSGRKIAYSKLRVTDATGRELPARMEVSDKSEIRNPKSEMSLAVLVNDTDAVYPVRIDPTFSDSNWISMGGIAGANGSVSAAVIDGLGNLYIGGTFTIVGDVFAKRIAKWNGTSWTALGSGMNDEVKALAVSGSDLYAGGYFTNAGGTAANYIAKWNGVSWTALGSGMGVSSPYVPHVYALAASGSNLYVGGSFATAGGSAAKNIAKWDGSSWSALGSGTINPVYALAVSGSDVYAGGEFSTAGGSAVNFIAKWNGNSWSALGSGMNLFVYALAVSGSDVYAGGSFTTAGGSPANRIAKWNGSSWSALGSGMDGAIPIVYALAVSGSNVYAGGTFETAGGTAANHIAKWNGSSWSALGSQMNSDVLALAVSGSEVYAGGRSTMVANYIAVWNGSNWSALGSGMNENVRALAVSGSDVYAGGSFGTADGSAASRRIAKWNGSNWSALGSGLNSDVVALLVSGSNVYAGGYFTNAGGTAANYIAKWNGSNWSALGSGMNREVLALAVSGNDLYAGGSFTKAGGTAASYIAKWNGNNWSALGSGMNSVVAALAVSDGDLYAGGYFTNAGGTAANYIAKWNGSNWSALGSGMNSTVLSLAASGGDVYAGGFFTTAGGSPVNSIAKWNGNSWLALGSGMNREVRALALSGNDVYAGGWFTTAGSSAANFIAKWDGSSWSALGSGVNNPVNALAVSGSDLYAGGYFTTAGGKVSGYVARAILIPELRFASGSLVVSNGFFQALLSGPVNTSVIIETSTTLTNWTPVATNSLPEGGWPISFPIGTDARGFYRARSQ